MARIRSIHPGIFTDEGFASLSMAARVLLLGVWTEADDHGVFEWKPVTLKMRVMPVDNVSIPELLAECERADVLKRFTSGKSYGLVRNFCRFQRPKKPKYTHPMPPELFLYAGLKEDGSLQVLHQSRTGGEMSPQREDGGGEGEEESGIEKGEGAKPSLSVVKDSGRQGDGPWPIDDSYQPSEPAIEYAYSLGMKKADLNSELSKFAADGMAFRKVSFDLDASFKKRCDQWLDYQRRNAPKTTAATPARQEDLTPAFWESSVKRWKSNNSLWPRGVGGEPGMSGCKCPANILNDNLIDPATGRTISAPLIFVEETTVEMGAHCHNAQAKRTKPPMIFEIEKDGVTRRGAFVSKKVPDGYDEQTGERIPPANSEVSAA